MNERNQPCPCGSGQKYKNCCGKPKNTFRNEVNISEEEMKRRNRELLAIEVQVDTEGINQDRDAYKQIKERLESAIKKITAMPHSERKEYLLARYREQLIIVNKKNEQLSLKSESEVMCDILNDS